MPELPRVSGSHAICALERLGFIRVRQRGSHVVLKKQTPQGDVGCAVPLHRDLAIGTLRGIPRQAAVANLDETGWWQRAQRAWLWTVVTDTLTLFRLDPSRSKAVVQALLAALKTDPGALSLDAILTEIAKLTAVRNLGLPTTPFADASGRIVAARQSPAIRRIRQRLGAEHGAELSEVTVSRLVRRLRRSRCSTVGFAVSGAGGATKR